MQEEVAGDNAAGEAAKEKVAGIVSAWMRMPGRTRAAVIIFAACLAVYLLMLFAVPRYKCTTTTQGDESLGLWSGWRLSESGRALHACLLGLTRGFFSCSTRSS